MRVGAALSTLVILGVSGLAYLLVADVYDMYPQLAYRAIFSVLGALIPLPLAFFFGLVTVRHTLSLHRLMASAARCMWGFFGLFLLTWLLEGLLIGEAPGPLHVRVCRHSHPVGNNRAPPHARRTRREILIGPGRASRSTTPSEARVWRSRGRDAAHRHTQRPGPTRQATRRPEICRGNEQHEAARPHRDRAAHTSGR